MKAVRLKSYGDIDPFVITESPTPTPQVGLDQDRGFLGESFRSHYPSRRCGPFHSPRLPRRVGQ